MIIRHVLAGAHNWLSRVGRVTHVPNCSLIANVLYCLYCCWELFHSCRLHWICKNNTKLRDWAMTDKCATTDWCAMTDRRAMTDRCAITDKQEKTVSCRNDILLTTRDFHAAKENQVISTAVDFWLKTVLVVVDQSKALNAVPVRSLRLSLKRNTHTLFRLDT